MIYTQVIYEITPFKIHTSNSTYIYSLKAVVWQYLNVIQLDLSGRSAMCMRSDFYYTASSFRILYLQLNYERPSLAGTADARFNNKQDKNKSIGCLSLLYRPTYEYAARAAYDVGFIFDQASYIEEVFNY